MTKNIKAVFAAFILMSLLSCSKEKTIQNASKKIEGDWQMVSRKVGGEDFFNVARIYNESSVITQCNDTIPYKEISIVQTDTLSFFSGKTLSHSTVVFKTGINYYKTYTNCILTDTSFFNYISSASADARNYPKDIDWEINYNDNSGDMHLTIIEPWKLYMPDGTELWYNYTYQYEIIRLNRNDLIIKGVNYSCFFGYVTTDEVIEFKKIR